MRNGDLGGGMSGYERATDWPIGVVAPREIAAGVEPAQRKGKAGALTGGLGHDAS